MAEGPPQEGPNLAGPRLQGLRGWTLTEGHVGMETQTRALATALGLETTVKRASAPRLWSWLPGRLWPCPLAVANAQGAGLVPPFPDILITCGRRSVPLALAIGRASRRGGAPGTFLVHIQNPLFARDRFDVLVVPAHDGVEGPNVVTCLGSVHGLTRARLTAEAEVMCDRFARLPRPLVTVLVGGSNGAYGIGPREIAALAERLAALQRTTGCGLAVVPSRRTSAENVALLKERLDRPGGYVWDGTGTNPYLALIGLADALIVTCDSVNMVSEATASERPVYVAMYPGTSARFDAFHAALRTRGHARMFEGAVDFAWRPVPLHEIDTVSEEITRRYRARCGIA